MRDIDSLLRENGLTEQEFVRLAKEQFQFVDKVPFDILKYGVNCESPVNEERYSILQEIHPRKRADVERIPDSDIPDSAHRIIIFGSATGIYCTPDSDLDVAIVGDRRGRYEREDPWLMPLRLGICDFVYTTDEDYEENCDNPASIGFDIKTKGITIWTRESDHHPSGV